MSDNEEDQQVQYSVQFVGDENKYPHLSKDGKGVATFANLDTYSGEYHDGKRSGVGEYRFSSSGAKYQGEYQDNLKHGQGSFSYPDGSVYEGEWKYNKKEGEGRYVYASGDVYEGAWKGDLKHGLGKYTVAQGKYQLRGKWIQGACVYGTWYTADGVQFTGHFVNNKPTGPGTFEFSNGHAQSGEFVYVKKGVREWKDSKFVAPSYDKPAPEPLSPSPSIAFRRLLDRSVLRADQYPGLDKVQAGERIAGVPNFHQTKNSSVFSMAQPTRKGVSELLGWLAEKGLNKVVVLNTRPDFCVYVQDNSFAPRDLKALNTAVVMPIVSEDEKTLLQTHLQQKLQGISKDSGQLEFYEPGQWEHPLDATHSLKTQANASIENVKLFSEVLADAATEKEVEASAWNFRLSETVEPAEYDAFAQEIKEKELETVSSDTAVVVCGADGLTSTVTVAALFEVVQRCWNGPLESSEEKPEEPQEEEEEEEEEEQGTEEKDHSDGEEADEDAPKPKKTKKAKKQKPVEQKVSVGPDYAKGEFEIIQRLVAALPGADKVKALVDDVLDRTAGVVNLRKQIIDAKELFEQETYSSRDDNLKESYAQAWKQEAQQALSRYFHFIAFAWFLQEKKKRGESEEEEEEEEEEAQPEAADAETTENADEENKADDSDEQSDDNADEDQEKPKKESAPAAQPPQKKKKERFPKTYADWVARNSDVMEILGSTSQPPLADFNWQ